MQRFLRSRFDKPFPRRIAVVKTESCTSCGRCTDICPPGAVSLCHRLYTKDGETPRGVSPCLSECPMHIPVQAVAALTAQGSFDEAMTLIKEHTPFPSLCSVCDRRCEDACVRDPVAAAELIAAAAERGVGTVSIPKRRYGEKIAVIGSGPAGLSCAYFLALSGFSDVTVFEKSPLPGGLLSCAVPPFLLDRMRLFSDIDAIKKLGVTIRCGSAADIDGLRAEGYKAFFVAVGAKIKPYELPGTYFHGVMGSTAFLRAVCLGERPVLGRKCAVIGSGAGAAHAARAVLRLGSEVTLLCPCSEEESAAFVRDAKTEGIKVMYSCRPAAIEESGRALLLNCGKTELKVSSVITEDEMLPDTAGFDLTAPDVFVGGACLNGQMSAADAAAEGKKAAADILRYLHGQDAAPRQCDRRSFDRARVMVALDTYNSTPRVNIGQNLHDLKHCRASLSAPDAAREARRCLNCGTAVIDEAKCIGCGLCVRHCAFGAVALTPSPR